MRRTILGTICLVIAIPTIVAAQDNRLWEVRPLVGMSIPVGTQRDLFKNAAFTGGEAALRILPTVDLLTSVAWQAADSKYRVPTTTASVWVFDIGIEKRLRDSLSRDAALVPFFGGGVGGRAYDFDSRDLVSRTCYAGYGAAGLALEWKGTAIRGEARGNVFCYESPISGVASRTGSDLTLSLGFGLRF